MRFPHGSIDCAGITIEPRQAIEPWHVLREEASGTGTARYVDSSVERLQLRVVGVTAARHAVTCNGRALPLTTTGGAIGTRSAPDALTPGPAGAAACVG